MTGLADQLTPGPAPVSATEGAGVVSSWADLGAAIGADDLDPAAITFTAAAAGLDTLGAVLQPFDSLLRAGLGWLIEHIDFLRQPLDALAGDPTEVLAQSRNWHHVAAELRATAADYRDAVVPGWDGAAAEAYRRATDELVGALREASAQADELSLLILATGAAVGTVRATIRDTITEFLSLVLRYLLAASTLAFLTAGGSLATVVLTVVVRALEVAEDICRPDPAAARRPGRRGRRGRPDQRGDAARIGPDPSRRTGPAGGRRGRRARFGPGAGAGDHRGRQADHRRRPGA